MNTRPFETIGLPLPGSGNAVFHLMFLSGAQVVGAFDSEEMPLPDGPRNAGQSSARSAPAQRNTPVTMPIRFAFIDSSRCVRAILAIRRPVAYYLCAFRSPASQAALPAGTVKGSPAGAPEPRR